MLDDVLVAQTCYVGPSVVSPRTDVFQEDRSLPINVSKYPICVRQLPESSGGRVISVFESCILGTCECTHHIGGVLSQLRPCQIGCFLYSNDCTLPSSMVKETWDGVCDGFSIVDNVEIPSYECQNYKSILEEDFSDQMSSIVMSDLEEGRINHVSHIPHCVHAMGGVGKSDGSLRPITDCSMPESRTINNFMETTCKKFSYKSVDTLAQVLSPGDYICVSDISSAFRSVSILPEHRTFQGLSWILNGEKMYFEGNRLTFGLKCAPYIFNLLSTMIVDMANSQGISRIVNYLDDFAIAESTEEECKISQSKLLRILRQIGFAVSWSKLEMPSTRVKFLGIIVDTCDMSLSLPLYKVEKLLEKIKIIESKNKATKKELESIAGLMAHCSSVVKGGRTFSRRVYDLCNNTARRSTTNLSIEILADFSWWKSFCNVFNGSAKIIPRCKSTSLISDSSMWGFGAWCDTDWLIGSWSNENLPCFDQHDHIVSSSETDVSNASINTLELWPVLVGLTRWAPMYRDSTIEIITDNSQVLYMINTGRSSSKPCMSWLREIFWLCFIYNVDIYACYIRSEDNVMADALSRCNNPGKLSLCKHLIITNCMCCYDMLDRSYSEGS